MTTDFVLVGPTAPRFYTTTRPPPTELLALQYFGPLLSPTPVATRVPSPSSTEDTINGFIRVEAAGGTMRRDQIFYDVSVLLHAYAQNTDEALAEELIQDAIAWGANAQGTTTVMTNGDQWYVAYSRVQALAVRKADPMVALTRYRAMVCWRMQGIPVIPGQMSSRLTIPSRRSTAPPAAQGPRPGRKAPPTASKTPPATPRPTRKGPPATSWT